MTIEQANQIAERLQSLPRLYDSPPDLMEGLNYLFYSTWIAEVYPWVKTNAMSVGASVMLGKADNLYLPRNGFSKKAYSGTITDWEATKVAPQAFSGSARYITIDDLRMIAYVGIEYAREKLGGWRYRYASTGEDASIYPDGCLVRLEDGQRFIHRKGGEGNVTAPPGSGGPYSDQLYAWKFWTPMRRMPGFGETEKYGFGYPDGFEVPSEPFTGIVQLGSLAGNDDFVKFIPDRGYELGYEMAGDVYKVSLAGDVYKASLEEGGMEIIITPENSISEDDAEEYPVVYQQNSLPVYYCWDDKESMQRGDKPWRIWKDPNRYSEWYYKLSTIEQQGGYVPLARGVSYNVFARFTDAVLKKYDGRNLVYFMRTGTRSSAPYMWQADTGKIQYKP